MYKYTLLSLLIASSAVFAVTGTFIAPDGSVTCILGSVQVTQAGNATMTVTGCEAFSCDTPLPPPPPPSPPPVTGDPGHGVWSPNSATTVFSLSPSSNRTFVPGCIDGQDWRGGCPYNGSLRTGHVYGARFKAGKHSSGGFKVDRAETGEQSAAVRGAVSAVPGSITATDPRCAFSPLNQSVEIMDTEAAAAYARDIASLPFSFPLTACVVPADVFLYLNFTAEDPKCGTGYECRVQVIER